MLNLLNQRTHLCVCVLRPISQIHVQVQSFLCIVDQLQVCVCVCVYIHMFCVYTYWNTTV